MTEHQALERLRATEPGTPEAIDAEVAYEAIRLERELGEEVNDE